MMKISFRIIIFVAAAAICCACVHPTYHLPTSNADIQVRQENLTFIKAQFSNEKLSDKCSIDVRRAHKDGIQSIKNADVDRYYAIYYSQENINASALKKQNFSFNIIRVSEKDATLITNVEVSFKPEGCIISVGHNYIGIE